MLSRETFETAKEHEHECLALSCIRSTLYTNVKGSPQQREEGMDGHER